MLPKPVNPSYAIHHSVLIVSYLLDFFLEKKPCTICSAVFVVAMALVCYSGHACCIFGCVDDDGELP